MNKKALSLLIVVVMVLAAVPAALSIPTVTAAPANETEEPPQVTTEMPNNFIPGEVLKKEIQKILESDGETVRLIVAPDKEHKFEVYETLKELGRIDPISKPEYQFIVVEMPISNVEKLAEIPGILHVWKDRTVKLEEPVTHPEVGAPSVSRDVLNMPDMFMSVFTIKAYDTWMNYGILGDNVTVAVLDTGIDVAHPFLQATLDGKRKIIDIYDASDEGIAQLFNATAPSSGVITVNKNVTLYMGYYSDLYYGHPSKYKTYTLTNYTVGNITGDAYYIGALPERYFDLNFDGDKDDVYPVLVVDNNGTYVSYLDTDMDNDFTDETPMGLFDDTGDYAVFEETLVTVALARVHIGDMDNPENYPYYVPYGDGDGYAMFMWDAHGHGTHVSGTIAGVGLPDDPVFSGVYGVAPNAQLIEVKVLPGEQGFGRTSWIINGMFYAALNGADVISMSLGGGGEINDGIESPENFYVNLLTDQYGVTFAIAAGNEGPSTNTVHSPGTSDLAITVGNYVDNERESYWYGVDLGVIAGPSMSSSRGPRDDGMIDPDVMAPGTDIFSSLPMWYTVLEDDPYYYYGVWSGTSMATPHVSGAVALMISYAKAHGLNYDPIMIKRALEMSAKPVNGTLIDQGFGLIQVDKAIETLEQLSQEPTTYIFAGTTYTSFKNPIEQPILPISPAYVDFNGYFQNMFGFPYLYRGIYLRNEYPGSVPIYFSPLVYEPDFGLWYVFENKAYRISTNVDWIILSTTEVTINGADAEDISDLIGQFSINIDYSKLQKSGVYVGLVYIDDPETSYIDSYVPVIVEIPMNKNGETHVKLSDTEKPGEAKHYFVKVPRGTKELRVTLRVPADANGVPMGRTKLVIAKPLGGVVHDGVPGYYYVGANPAGYLYEYTWVVEDPVEGTWEITAYSSTFTKYWSGYDTSQYEIEVSISSVSVNPEIIYKDIGDPDNTSVEATFTNEYVTFNASAFGYGMGRLDVAWGEPKNVSQDELDVIGAFYVDPTTYFLRLGITDPEDPNADLDLYIFYYETYDQLISEFDDGYLDEFTEVYEDQIGPTSEEVFEQFMPKSGYYLVAVYGYDTVGYNPIQYTFYYQMLSDNGDVSVDSTPFEFANGTSMDVKAEVSLEDNGTYLGVIGLTNIESNNIITYVPMIMQVGKPTMTMIVSENATLGKRSVLKIKLIDPVTGEVIDSPTKVIVNGRPYYTEDGHVAVYFVPTSTEEIFTVQVVNEMYKDIIKKIKIKVSEPVAEPVKYIEDISAEVIEGNATIVEEPKVEGNTVELAVYGETNTTTTVIIVLPKNAKVTEVHVEPEKNLIEWWVEKGKKATYVFVKVKFASVNNIALKYTFPKKGVSLAALNFLGYRWYNMYKEQFDELYKKAIELGVDNETLQQALQYHETAAEYYQEVLDIVGEEGILLHLSDIRILAPLRKAYLNEIKAVEILKKAIEELENSED